MMYNTKITTGGIDLGAGLFRKQKIVDSGVRFFLPFLKADPTGNNIDLYLSTPPPFLLFIIISLLFPFYYL
jgi:hypothetical protein